MHESHKIVINADDVFMSPAIDTDIIEAAKNGQITSCSGFATVRSPANLEATSGAVCSLVGGMGLHIDLSFGEPLSPFFEKKESDSGWRSASDQPSLAIYVAEFKAQADKLSKRVGGKVTHSGRQSRKAEGDYSDRRNVSFWWGGKFVMAFLLR